MRLTGELEGSSAAFGSGLQLGHEVHQCAGPLTLACGAFSAHIFYRRRVYLFTMCPGTMATITPSCIRHKIENLFSLAISWKFS